MHLAGTVLIPRDESLVGVRALRGGELADQHVRRFEDPRPRTEVGVQGELGRLFSLGRGELLRELEQVEERCPAPRVDVLIRVAHRGHRMAAAEDAGHQARLRDVRVLILVEEHRGEAVAILLGDLGVPLHDVERELDLIAEVDHPELALQLPEDRACLRQLDALPGRSVGSIRAVLLELLEPVFVELHDLVRGAEVVGRLIVEGQDPVHDAGEPLRLDDLERHPVEDPPAELDPLRRREDPLVRLDADQDAVAVEELGREPVVVGDLGLLTVGEVEAAQRAADALLEVLGGLVGEREAEHVAGQDALVLGGKASEGDERQVDDPRRHHRCLPGSRARHEHVGLERPRDRTPLLLRWRSSAQDVEDLLREGHGVAHLRPTSDPGSPTSNNGRPSGKREQSDWNSQKKQFAW